MAESPVLRSRLIFPNPFLPVGIEFDLSTEAEISLEILDAEGRTILIPEPQRRFGPGSHRIETTLPREQGTAYAYRLTARSSGGDDVVETKFIRSAAP